MLEFIKMFGLGIVYTILSPVFLVVFALFAIYSLFNYLACEAINLGGFFLGRKFDEKTSLDKQYLKMKKEEEKTEEIKETIEEKVEKGGDLDA